MPYSVHVQKESTNQRVKVQENISLYRGIELKYWDFKRKDTNTWCFILETVMLSQAGTRVELCLFISLTIQPVVIDICPKRCQCVRVLEVSEA